MDIRGWRELLSPYELAVEEIILKLRHVIREIRQMGEYCPMEQVDGRVKKISSILAKARKKNIPLSDIENRLEDIAGIRIMCQFTDDIYTVVEQLKKRRDMKIVQEIDYVSHPKESGYQSYHLVLHYTVEGTFGSKTVAVEVQIRTLAMNFWAVIEHSLQYKYDKNLPVHVRERLTAAAEAVRNLDTEMNLIRSEILDAQASFALKANLVHDIMTNIKHLFEVANKEKVMELQSEFLQIYNEGSMDRLADFSTRVDRLAASFQIQETEHEI